MKIIKYFWIVLLFFNSKSHAQLQLVNLNDLEQGMENHQMGKIPVFKSALLQQGVEGQPKVVSDRLYDIYDSRNLMAVIDGQLVVFPQEMLAISNGFKPFKNLMNISNGIFKLEFGYGVAHWNETEISNGFFYFRGFASLKGVQVLKGTASTLSLADWKPTQTSTAVTSDDTGDCWDWGNCDDGEYDIELDLFLDELGRTHNPWDMVTVMVDGMLVEMSAGALSAHLRNGAYRLGGGDGRMPEFP